MIKITVRRQMKPSQSPSANPLVEEYLKSLSPMELKAYHIAKDHLGTTFNIEKANAFLQWKNKRETDKHEP